MIVLHLLLAIALILSTFQFNAGIYRTLWYFLWLTPTIGMSFLAVDTLTYFPYFWDARLLGHHLPAPPLLPLLFSRSHQFVVMGCFVALESSVLYVLWRIMRVAKSPNLTYLSRRRVLKG